MVAIKREVISGNLDWTNLLPNEFKFKLNPSFKLLITYRTKEKYVSI